MFNCALMIKAFPLRFNLWFPADLMEDEMIIKSFWFSKSMLVSMVLLAQIRDAFGYFAKLCKTFAGCIMEAW